MIKLIAFLIIFFSLLFVFLGVLYFFFSFTFIKHDVGDTDNLDEPVNRPLQDYRETIQKGIDYINFSKCKWVSIQSFDGLTLFARYFDIKSDKTVILMHGYRSSAARDFSCAVEMYEKLGFNVLLCDQRAHGRSEGRIISFGIKESRDTVSWAKYISIKYNPNKILLGGMSMGATTVILSLAHGLPENVKAVIADCGFTSAIDIIIKVGKQAFKFNPRLFLPFLNIYCKLFGHFSLYGKSTVDVIKKTNIPVLLIHGKDDGFVPYEMSEHVFEVANKNCDIVIVDKANHGLSYLVDKPLVEKKIKQFLKNNNLL